MTKKVMKLLNPETGLMECTVCGTRHYAQLRQGGKYFRGNWQCENGCQLEKAIKKDECNKQLAGKIAKEEMEVN